MLPSNRVLIICTATCDKGACDRCKMAGMTNNAVVAATGHNYTLPAGEVIENLEYGGGRRKRRERQYWKSRFERIGKERGA